MTKQKQKQQQQTTAAVETKRAIKKFWLFAGSV